MNNTWQYLIQSQGGNIANSHSMFPTQNPVQTQVQNTGNNSWLSRSANWLSRSANWMSDNANGFGTTMQAINGLAGLGVNAWLGSKQLELAEAQLQAQNAQRQTENDRYTAQLKRLTDATDDAVSTASSLKSATAQIATPQQNNTQAQAKPTQNAEKQDLPMQRE